MRISFTKADENGVRVSRKVYPMPNGANVKIVLNTNNLSYSIDDIDSGVNLAVGNAVSYQMLLKSARRALTNLGVEIKSELRSSRESKPDLNVL